MSSRDSWKIDTKVVLGPRHESDPRTRSHRMPIYMTSTFLFDNCAQGGRIFKEEEEGYGLRAGLRVKGKKEEKRKEEGKRGTGRTGPRKKKRKKNRKKGRKEEREKKRGKKKEIKKIKIK